MQDKLPNGKFVTCVGCPLLQAPGPVMGEGPSDAKILIVGEAPGEEEARSGRPFIGGAGRVLSRMLHQAGLQRQECYVTNVVKCRPPGNRTPTDEEIRSCAAILTQEVVAVRPNLVLGVGATPLYT